MNLCPSCGLDFSSIRAFDTHRDGKQEYTREQGLSMNPAREDGRRCMPEDELPAAGFVQNTRGRWGLAHQMDRARERFSARPGASEAPPRRA